MVTKVTETKQEQEDQLWKKQERQGGRARTAKCKTTNTEKVAQRSLLEFLNKAWDCWDIHIEQAAYETKLKKEIQSAIEKKNRKADVKNNRSKLWKPA